MTLLGAFVDPTGTAGIRHGLPRTLRRHSLRPLRAPRALVVSVAVGLSVTALAQVPVPAPAASAASAPAASTPMSIVGEWQGPFPGTKVVKLLDGADGVACYFYVPVSVPSNTVCNGNEGCSVQYPSGTGTVSCVKVREAASAHGKAPAAPRPRR